MPLALLAPPPPLLRPMPGVITQGVRTGHPAIDIACRVGTPVVAAHDGQMRVVRSVTHGITVELRGSGGLETSYSHLQQAEPARLVRAGERIGACGNTGAWSSGPHLHFEASQPELLGNLLTPAPGVPLPPAPRLSPIAAEP